MIKKNQVYRSCDPREGASRQIRITSYIPGAPRAHIVSHPDGKRFRQILVSELHRDELTKDGNPRRRGYLLISDPIREPFDPRCTKWAPFCDLQVGDWIDYWGTARRVVEHTAFDDGRVRILVDNEHGGRDFALAPGIEEGTWRVERPEEVLDAHRGR